MNAQYRDILRSHARPLLPIPTGERSVLRPVKGIRSVLFDVYGTLVISASGEVGTQQEAAAGEAFSAALDTSDIRLKIDGDQGVRQLLETIGGFHGRSRNRGIEYPEVDIVEVWRSTVQAMSQSGQLSLPPGGQVDYHRLATEYEARANPVWPMPGVAQCLAALRGRGLLLGLVSNAQFFTPLVFEALLNQTPEELGFDPDLQVFSYRLEEAKPSGVLYDVAVRSLRRRGIEPEAALYVGNDLLNDITPASKVGFVTALFAGDARSLRRRAGDRRVEGIEPDLTLTSLVELIEVVAP